MTMGLVAISRVLVHVVMMSVMLRMSVGRGMCVAAVHGTFRTAEQAANLRGFKQSHDFGTRNEAKGDVLEMVRIHDRIHDQTVYGHGNVYESISHDGRPVLVAESVTKLNAAFDELIGRQRLKAGKIDDQHIA